VPRPALCPGPPRTPTQNGTATGKVNSLKAKLDELQAKQSLMSEDNEEDPLNSSCCVCMERNKKAALVPCGHTLVSSVRPGCVPHQGEMPPVSDQD